MSDVEQRAAEKGTNGINGVADDEVVLMTEEELEKAKMRPADIDQDMKEMERRKRVENIMNSALFREELERVIETQIQEGYTGFQTLQNISEMIGIPSSRTSIFRSSQSVIPINDIRGMESLNFAKGEKILRCKLAAVYRLIDMHGWTQSVYNHCTVRVSQDTEHFLLNPFGLLYHEITAASLVKVDMQGNIVDPGSTNFGVNVAGFLLHSAIHAARPDIRCIVHIHHPAVVAVSAFKDGLLPLSQESLLLGDISYHDYCGIFVNPEEKEKLARSLGPINKVMFLRNHGVVCCGETVEESWYNIYNTVLACETQMKMIPCGLENLILVSDEARQFAYETAHKGSGGVDSKQESGPNQQGPKERKFRVGDLEFEALMRSLDNAGLRTGYIYRRPLIKSEPARLQSDVAFPPAASNYSHLFDEDDSNRSPLKRILDGRKAQDKSRWLNSPNTYSKVEVLETGTPDPKKITKWVADDSPTHSTSVKLEDNLMFVPKYTDPKEFKRIQKMIKENRRIGNISAGPTSHLLEGVTWEEARRMQDASMSSTGDHVILVGAASKGIIQREFQHNAVVYKTPYAKNPFDAISDQELEEYKQTIERKQRGEPEEIEIEQMNITPQLATRDIVDDSNQVTSPMSPLSDDDASAAHQLQFETKMVPRASKAQSVIVSDDGNIRQKPAVPPKPIIPKMTQSQGALIGSYTSPQKVQTSMKVLPQRDCPSPDGRFSSGDSSAATSPLRASSNRATLPRAPGNKTNHESMRTNSLSRGLAKMLKLSRSKDDEEEDEDFVKPELVKHDVARISFIEHHQVPHVFLVEQVSTNGSMDRLGGELSSVTDPAIESNFFTEPTPKYGSVTYAAAGQGSVTYVSSDLDIASYSDVEGHFPQIGLIDNPLSIENQLIEVENQPTDDPNTFLTQSILRPTENQSKLQPIYIPKTEPNSEENTNLQPTQIMQPLLLLDPSESTKRKDYVVRRVVEEKPGHPVTKFSHSYLKSFKVSKVSPNKGDALANGEETEAHHSTMSHSSKEGSPTKDTSLTDDSISKDKKKKKKGLRTPSFLKKKKDKKKEKEAALQS